MYDNVNSTFDPCQYYLDIVWQFANVNTITYYPDNVNTICIILHLFAPQKMGVHPVLDWIAGVIFEGSMHPGNEPGRFRLCAKWLGSQWLCH